MPMINKKSINFTGEMNAEKNKSLITIYEQDETISDRIFMQEINTWEYIDAGIKNYLDKEIPKERL